jgi:hypothetical protein
MPVKTTAKEWNEVRAAFASSIMVKTALSSLAQNLDGPDWPIKAKDETPAKYIGLGFEEAAGLIELQGLPPERIDLLVTILRDTLSFDTPFGDMVEQSQAAADRDNPILKNLAKLDIPASYPIELTALSADTKEFCRREKLVTISEFAVAAQGMSQTVIVGGDFRTLLNALSHIDEKAIAQFLPYRPGAKGLHLIEAVAQTVRILAASERAAVTSNPANASPALRSQIEKLVTQLSVDHAELERELGTGTSLARLASVLHDSAVESTVVALLTPHLKAATKGATASAEKSGGWFSRFFKK